MRRARHLFLILAVLALLGAACSDDDGGDDTATDEGTTEAEVGDPATTLAEGETTEATETTEGTEAADAVEGTITVFAAASLTDVFTELGEAFEEANPDATVEFSFGPSSGLVTQITEGAPADVIATASTATMDDLVAAEGIEGEPTDFATNRLQMAVPTGNPGEVEGLADLADEDLVVGLCAEEVPCGDFARRALDALGITPSIDTDAEDVRSLLTQVEAGQVDVGVVYETDVIAAGDSVEGIEIPEEENVVASYPIAPTAEAENTEGADAFIAFILSDEGQQALADAGFRAAA